MTLGSRALLKIWRQGWIIGSCKVLLLLVCLLCGRGPLLGEGSEVTCGFREAFDRQELLWDDVPHSQTRIIGGVDSIPGEWPWMVSLQMQDGHFCGGSVISHWWILSASHCFLDVSVDHLRVLAGETTLEEDRHVLRVEKVIIHPDYSKRSGDNDIALLLLSSALHFSRMAGPVCLPPSAEYHPESWKTCYVTGWGATTTGAVYAHPVLKKVKLLLFSFKQCLDWMWLLTDNMLCAGISEGGKDACQGDSGGPLVCRSFSSKTWYQIGIVSWGKGCGEPKKPGVYTVVSHYIDWIHSATTAEGRPFEVIYPMSRSKDMVNDRYDFGNVTYSTGPGKNVVYCPLLVISPGLVMLFR